MDGCLYGLRDMYVCELGHANSHQTGAESPAITSTGLFLPVGWFLPLCSLHFLHTHISLQQPYLFLNLAEVLWRIWKSDNSLFSSLSSFALSHFDNFFTVSLRFCHLKDSSPSFPSDNDLLNCEFSRFHFQRTFAQNVMFLPFSTPRLLFNFPKNSNNIPETSWCGPSTTPFPQFPSYQSSNGPNFLFLYRVCCSH